MYTGHVGLALGVKGFQKQVSLWLLCVAALSPDIVDFSAQTFHVGTGVWTHTLPAMIGATILFFAAGWFFDTQSGRRSCYRVPRLLACLRRSSDKQTPLVVGRSGRRAPLVPSSLA